MARTRFCPCASTPYFDGVTVQLALLLIAPVAWKRTRCGGSPAVAPVASSAMLPDVVSEPATLIRLLLAALVDHAILPPCSAQFPLIISSRL